MNNYSTNQFSFILGTILHFAAICWTFSADLFLHSVHFLEMSLQNVFSLIKTFADMALPRFDFVSFSRMFWESWLSGKPFGADLADERVLLKTRLLNVNLKPDICGELSRTFLTRKVLLQMRFSNVLKHGTVTGIALVAMLTNVLPLL
jgi:hypothetical protein